jgi:protein phosphatase
MQATVKVDLLRQELEEGDILLLCCDGLSGMVTDQRMADLVRASGGDLKRAVQALIDAANEAGGVDNITVVLAQYHA